MLDRTTPPPFNNSTSFDLIEPTSITLTNGLLLQFIAGGEQEVVRIEFLFNAGRWYENQCGLAHFTSGLLTKGTKLKSSFEIAQIFDQYGAHVEVSPGLDTVTLSIYSLVKNLRPVLELCQEVLATPSFPEKELKQSKSVFLQNLKVNQEKTSFVASTLIRKTIFGIDHPYGKEIEEEDVLKLEPIQLANYYQDYFTATHVFVSGKLNDDTRELITESLSDFSAATHHVKNYNFSAASLTPIYQPKEGSSQTSIRLGKKSILRNHPDYADVLFLNHVLGGFFGSRLMKNIREEKGLSYGIYSALHALQHDGYMVIGADVNKDNRLLATEEIRKEIARLGQEQIGHTELQTARLHFIGSLQAEITTPFAHADKLKNITVNNLSKDYYKNLIHRINTVTAAELITVAQQYFDETSFSEVAVG